MHRLFVALRIPRHLRRQLALVDHDVPGARWVEADELHLTLRFIGEVDRHQADDVAASLAGVRHAPVVLTGAGIGRFDTRGRPNSLWAAIDRSDPLVALHGAVARALSRAGIPHEARAFRPHVTLARLSRGAGSIEPWLARHMGLRCAAEAATAVQLVESELTPAGAHYAVAATYPLA